MGYKDLTNQKFDRLTAIKYAGLDKHNNAMWECICDCDNRTVKIISGASLRRGLTKSCGCLHSESARKQGQLAFKDISGMIFGRLTVESKHTQDKWGEFYWKCKCECGNQEHICRGASLRAGTIKSCGCLRNELTSERSKRYNTYDLTGEHGIGYDTRGNEFLFDIIEYERLKLYYWSEHNGYFSAKEKNKKINMHRFILNCEDDEILQVDHVNQCKHDNRKENLRLVTHQQNAWNTGLRVTNTSGVKGVYYNKKKDMWFAKIVFDYKQIHLGYFVKKEDAIKARKEGEEFYFGEYNPITNT